MQGRLDRLVGQVSVPGAIGGLAFSLVLLVIARGWTPLVIVACAAVVVDLCLLIVAIAQRRATLGGRIRRGQGQEEAIRHKRLD
jgi:hypothetical protein